MLFNSWQFLVFFPAVALLHFLIPYRFRWILLLAASYYFYAAWRVEYLALVVASTLIDYFAAIWIDRSASRIGRRLGLAASLVTNLGLLFSFKYFNFFNSIIADALANFSLSNPIPRLDVLLPVGISFYTFQTLSYTFEVYKGNQPVERHLGRFALYVAFFPQLVAGPIERSVNLLPQFREKHDFNPGPAIAGLRLVLWGMFKKVVIADNLGQFVNAVYNNPEQSTGLLPVLATVFFAFQIYCDFSGYSDIAIGTARILGFDLMVNFRRPYKARTIGEFWQRWHVSLSTWFRDYVYIPLGGSRVSANRWMVNIFITFTVSGLWHGANTTFILWGALHGLYYLAGHLTEKPRQAFVRVLRLESFPGLHAALQIALTFVLVCFSWVFFRANNMGDALVIIVNSFSGWDEIVRTGALEPVFQRVGFHAWQVACMAGVILFLVNFEALDEEGDANSILARFPTPVRWTLYLALTLATLNLGVTKEIPFIYFQF